MDTDLRVPVTREQKALLQEATEDEPEGMAAWVRAVLLAAAKRKRARKNAAKPDKEGGGRKHRPAGANRKAARRSG